jgi:hypothetical protein
MPLGQEGATIAWSTCREAHVKRCLLERFGGKGFEKVCDGHANRGREQHDNNPKRCLLERFGGKGF